MNVLLSYICFLYFFGLSNILTLNSSSRSTIFYNLLHLKNCGQISHLHNSCWDWLMDSNKTSFEEVHATTKDVNIWKYVSKQKEETRDFKSIAISNNCYHLLDLNKIILKKLSKLFWQTLYSILESKRNLRQYKNN